MKKILFGAAAALAIAAPGMAAADTSGTVSFGYNSVDDDSDSSKEDYLNLGGSVVTGLDGAWSLQFDGDIADMGHESHTDTFATATVHAFTRNDSYAFGGFAGFTGAEAPAYYIGGEGAFYLNRFTIAGSALVGANREDDDTAISNVGVAATYFVTDTFSIGADANSFSFFDGDQDGVVYGLNAEYQFANAFSVFGGYHTSDIDSFGTDEEVEAFSIGMRFNFGTSSLIERDRSGASMLGASQMTRSQVFGW